MGETGEHEEHIAHNLRHLVHPVLLNELLFTDEKLSRIIVFLFDIGTMGVSNEHLVQVDKLVALGMATVPQVVLSLLAQIGVELDEPCQGSVLLRILRQIEKLLDVANLFELGLTVLMRLHMIDYGRHFFSTLAQPHLFVTVLCGFIEVDASSLNQMLSQIWPFGEVFSSEAHPINIGQHFIQHGTTLIDNITASP